MGTSSLDDDDVMEQLTQLEELLRFFYRDYYGNNSKKQIYVVSVLSKSSLLVDVTGYKNNISMKGAFIMSLIDTIISKALEFEGVSESPPGSNNVIFNTDYYGGGS